MRFLFKYFILLTMSLVFGQALDERYHNYDDVLVRLKLKQAFGRLIRKNNDYGVFVMLDKAMPSRLESAFPKDVDIQRLTLSETISETRNFLFKQIE